MEEGRRGEATWGRQWEKLRVRVEAAFAKEDLRGVVGAVAAGGAVLPQRHLRVGRPVRPRAGVVDLGALRGNQGVAISISGRPELAGKGIWDGAGV